MVAEVDLEVLELNSVMLARIALISEVRLGAPKAETVLGASKNDITRQIETIRARGLVTLDYLDELLQAFQAASADNSIDQIREIPDC